MAQGPITITADRTAVGILAAVSFLVPLAFGSSLADPFAFPKRAVMVAAAVLLSGLALVGRPGPEHARVSSPAILLTLLFTGCALFTCATALNRGLALWGFLDILVGAGLFAATVRFVRQPESARLIFSAFLASGALVGLASLTQIAVAGAGSGWLSVLLPPNRGGATLGDPGLTAQFLILALPVGVGAAALSSGAWRLACGALLGVVATALVFVGRPEGWIVGGAALGLVVLARIARAAGRGGRWSDLAPDPAGESLRSFLIAIIVVLLGIALSRLTILQPSGKPIEPLDGVSLLTPTTGDPFADRPASVSGTLALIQKHPLGVGAGNWRHAFLEVAWTAVAHSPFTLSHQAVHAGNSFLEIASETGLLGGLAFALLVALLLLQSLRAGLRAEPPWDGIASASFALIGSMAVMAFFGAPFQEPAPSLIFWIAAGLTQVAGLQMAVAPGGEARLMPRGRPPRLVGPLGRPVASAIAIVWGIFALGLGWLVVDRSRASAQALTGQGAYYSGQYEAALHAFGQSACRRSPEHLPRALAASAYLRLRFYDSAVREFDETLKRSPYFVSAFLGRGAARETQGLWDQADADYRAALRIWPRNPEILLASARLNTSRGRLDDALDNYREVIQVDPGAAETYFRMGEIFLRRKQLDSAIEAFRVCGMKNPKYPGMHIRLGDSFFLNGLHEEALRYYQAAAGIDDKSVEVRLRIANTLHALGRPCEAREPLEAARDLETDATRRGTILELIKKVESDCRKQSRKPSGTK
ncbi:MAG TPA: tetratricopeptide repeat protein [Candidatus Polarisedimenticolia bacterium]|jgi:tetratricopeptide (TPR) repeat protein/O-antigen ligase|nr:tetratricopeptide repeat protein [Candidatus Polarisedimenticolia bacterium]